MNSTSQTSELRFIEPPIAPHLLFFWLYNAIYFFPLLVVFVYGYEGGDAAEAIALDTFSITAIAFIYAKGLLGFTLGSIWTNALIQLRNIRTRSLRSDRNLRISIAEQLSIFLIACLFICAKLALVPLGVYHVYAAESGEMAGGLWSFSMVLSEFLVLASLLALLSDTRKNVMVFVILTVINSVNLLHGTRIIFIVSVMSAIFYAYLRGILSIRRLLLFAPIAFTLVLGVAYWVFASRSKVDIDSNFSFAQALSPIVYESVFSQLSLRNVVNTPDIVQSTGSLPTFLSDLIIFTAPRFLVPDKDSLVSLTKFSYMSPLGSFNGYATGLIYFGVFWPIFYTFLGAFASWLYAKAKQGPYWFVLYAYFCADVLFRFMRDGYLIPLKILVDIAMLMMFILALKATARGLEMRKRRQMHTV